MTTKLFIELDRGLRYEGLYLVNQYLEQNGLFMLPDWFSVDHIDKQLDPENIIEYKDASGQPQSRPVVYRGKFAKRVAQYQKAVGKPKVPKHLTDHIGTLAAKYSTDAPVKIPYDIAYNVCGWDPGDFGETGQSCYWDRWRSSPSLIKNNNGFAIRLYHPKNPVSGIGRAMVIPIWPDAHVVFNGYLVDGVLPVIVDIPAMFMAMILSRHLSKETGEAIYYSQVGISNFGKMDGPLYLNHDAYAWLVGSPSAISGIDEIDLEIDTSEWEQCERCENVNEADGFYEVASMYMCNDCIQGLLLTGEYIECSRCGEIREARDGAIILDTGDRVCARCAGASRSLYSCDECFEQYIGQSLEWKDNVLCPNCVEKLGLTECYECDDLTNSKIPVIIDGEPALDQVLCGACASAWAGSEGSL